MTNLNLLLPPPAPITQVNVWATVTQASPLRIQVDGDAAALPITPDTLVAGLAVNDRVYVALSTNTDPKFNARQAVITGRSGGTPLNPFPVGAIYVSVVSTNPGTLFGGTWAALQDAFLVGAGNLYAVNATGGEATHTLTVNELPAHDFNNGAAHPYVSDGTFNQGGNVFSASGSAYGFTLGKTPSVGGGAGHNNLPPYLAVYMWKRTA